MYILVGVVGVVWSAAEPSDAGRRVSRQRSLGYGQY